MTALWVSNPKFTARVVIYEDKRYHCETIMNAAPVFKKFIGQPFVNLLVWMRKWGAVRVVKIGEA